VTYLHFHLIFLLPPLALLGVALARSSLPLPERTRWALPAILLIALAYTTPWDNYLVYRGVWGYGEGRVIGTIGWVPVEEYLFFLLQPLAVGMLLVQRVAREAARPGEAAHPGAATNTGKPLHAGRPAHAGEPSHGPSPHLFPARLGGVALHLTGAALGLAGVYAGGAYTYGGLILAWACPVLAAQWWFAAPAALRYPRAFAHALVWPTLYLWIADGVAIRAGVWSIAPDTRTGAQVMGLPVEEMLFFLVTNLLVVQGLLWLLAPTGEAVFSPARVGVDAGAVAS
jgi:lycopene cyclase domain-containing protein